MSEEKKRSIFKRMGMPFETVDEWIEISKETARRRGYPVDEEE